MPWLVQGFFVFEHYRSYKYWLDFFSSLYRKYFRNILVFTVKSSNKISMPNAKRIVVWKSLNHNASIAIPFTIFVPLMGANKKDIRAFTKEQLRDFFVKQGDKVLKGTVFTKYKLFVENCFNICSRQALHAKTLGFTHPTTGQRMEFDSEIPEDINQVLDRWRNYFSSRK